VGGDVVSRQPSFGHNDLDTPQYGEPDLARYDRA
jgi:hypothetical protein